MDHIWLQVLKSSDKGLAMSGVLMHPVFKHKLITDIGISTGIVLDKNGKLKIFGINVIESEDVEVGEVKFCYDNL